jgi:uncharacterized phage-associated protein
VYDVRSLANWVLDSAEKAGRPVSNMALNKLLYFIYFHLLVENGVIITEARIEAWEHGPVFREVYHGFKSYGNKPITGRVEQFDIESRRMKTSRQDLSPDDAAEIGRILEKYIWLDAHQLREISHLPGGPWYHVWYHEEDTNPGMVISDQHILRFAAQERISH